MVLEIREQTDITRAALLLPTDRATHFVSRNLVNCCTTVGTSCTTDQQQIKLIVKCKSSPYSTAESRVSELIPVLGSQLAGDVSHKPGGRLPLLFARLAVTIATLKKAAIHFRRLVNRDTMGVNSLPKTVTRQRRGCDLNQGPSAPESSTLTTRLPSHPVSN